VEHYSITGRVNRWAGAHTCCMLAKDFEVGDWVTVNGEGDTLCKVWSSIAGTAIIVPLKTFLHGRMVRRGLGFHGSECFTECLAQRLMPNSQSADK